MINNPIMVNPYPVVEQATPSISVSSSGLITSTASQSAGLVNAGSKSATKQLTTKAGTTITPGTSAKTAISSQTFATGAINVAGDANLIASNIKSGVSIFGVNGSASSWVLYTNRAVTGGDQGYISISMYYSLPQYVFLWPYNTNSITTSSTLQRMFYAIYTPTRIINEMLYRASTKVWTTWTSDEVMLKLSGSSLRISTSLYWDTAVTYNVLICK